MKAYRDYGYHAAHAGHMHAQILPCLFQFTGSIRPETRILDVGCGNGYICGEFLKRGCNVVGIDLSPSGIEIARQSHVGGRFEILAADDQLLATLGEDPFDLVISTEVVEHLYDPRAYALGCFGALKTGGKFICTTPYHGYLKNLAISVAERWDQHADPLWDGGHIKLWSRRTLTQLLEETGFRQIQCRGIGRAPWLWMTMMLCGTKPAPQKEA